MRALVSFTERDAGLTSRWVRHLPKEESTHGQIRVGPELFGPFATALGQAGLRTTCRDVTTTDVDELGSSWTKRLGIPSRRAAWLLEARKP